MQIPDELATDALVGKFARTASTIERTLRRSLALHECGLTTPKARARRMLSGLVKAMRPVHEQSLDAGILSADEADALGSALATVETYRPLRNDLAHAVVLQHSIGLAILNDDQSTTPLTTSLINEAGAALIHAWTVLDDINAQVQLHLEAERRRALKASRRSNRD